MKLTFFGDVYISDETKFSYLDMHEFAPYVFNFEFAHYGKEIPHALNKILLKSMTDLEKIFHPLPIAVDVNNNHIFDYCDDGLLQTMEYLNDKNISFFGAGLQEKRFNNPFLVELGGKKIALLGYYHRNRDKSDGILKLANFSEEQFMEDMEYCNILGADIVIPSVHWGVEDSPIYTKMQQEAAHFMINNGAALVIGHHPHCIQPWECYKGKYIFYSLGNFVFDDIYTKSKYSDEAHYACMHCKRWHKWNRQSLGVTFDLESSEIQLHLMYQRKKTVRKLDITSEEIFKRYQAVKCSSFKTLLRKVVSSFSSFFFFHGHIFYWPGFREEIKLLFRLHVKNKNWTYSE